MNKIKILILVIVGIVIGLGVALINRDRDTEVQSTSGFNLYCNTNIDVEDNKANIMVKNKKSNTDNCMIQLVVDDNILYESDILKPNTNLDEVELSKQLDAGTYAGEIVFNVLDSNNEVKGIYNIEVSLTVK